MIYVVPENPADPVSVVPGFPNTRLDAIIFSCTKPNT
jgi:hypothetical protein